METETKKNNMRKLKVSFEEIKAILEQKLNIKKIVFMRENDSYKDGEIMEMFDYVEGNLK